MALDTRMKNATGWRFRRAKDNRKKNEHPNKADNVALKRQCDLEGCETRRGHAKRNGILAFEHPIDAGGQRRTKRD